MATPIVRIGGPAAIGGPAEPTPLPSARGALPPGDYGIGHGEGGSTRATIGLLGISCDSDVVLRVRTEQGVVFAEIPAMPEWDCERALDQWKKVAAGAKLVGLRYAVEGGNGSLALVADTGGSLTVGVNRAWRE